MYNIILVGGDDAAQFLQGQLTQDVELLTPSALLPAAWCNAQGRVVLTLQVFASDGDYGLLVPGDMAQAAMARLEMYRLRSKVTFRFAGPGWQQLATHPAALPAEALPGVWHGPAAGVAVEVVVAPGADAPAAGFPRLDEAGWKTARIQAGRVDIGSANTALYTPHMLNLDLAGAISFRKGCYTGQEIVARTENLGRSKRRTFRYRCDAPDLQIGDKLQDDAADAGVIVNVCGNDLLAVTAVAAAGRSLQIRGSTAIPQPLPYEVT